MDSLRRISRVAGIGYLIVFITGIYSNFIVLEGLIIPGNAVSTFNNLADHDMTFRLGILSFFIMVIFDLFLAWALFILLKPVNKDLSLFSGWLRLVNGTIFGVALYKLFGVLHFTVGEGSLNTINADFSQTEVMQLLNSFNNIWLIGLVFFGLHLVVLGYLIIKSEYIPKIIGIFLLVASLGYLIDSFANFLLPSYSDYESIFMLIVVIPGVIGELSFTLWLLIKGVNVAPAD